MEIAITPAQARNTLVGIRAGIGIGGLLAPKLTGKLFGIDVTANPAAIYMARLFAARELFMAAPFFMEDAEELQAYALEAGVIVDGVDVVSALAAGATKALPKRAAFMAAATAAAAVGLGILAQQAD